MSRFDAFAPPSRTRSAPAPSAPPGADGPPRWLTYRCAKCGARVYSGFTSSALDRQLAQAPQVQPDFFHADCGVETSLAQADLRYDDDTPWTPGR